MSLWRNTIYRMWIPMRSFLLEWHFMGHRTDGFNSHLKKMWFYIWTHTRTIQCKRNVNSVMFGCWAAVAPEPLTLCLPPSVSADLARCGLWFHFPHFPARNVLYQGKFLPDEDYLEPDVLCSILVSLRITQCFHDLQFPVAFVPQHAYYSYFLGLKELVGEGGLCSMDCSWRVFFGAGKNIM